MPMFEFKCKTCGEIFEELVSSSKTGSVECEKCGSKDTEKLMSTFASTGSSNGDSAANSCSPVGGFT